MDLIKLSSASKRENWLLVVYILNDYQREPFRRL